MLKSVVRTQVRYVGVSFLRKRRRLRSSECSLCSASKRQLPSAQGRVLERSGRTTPWVHVSSESGASCKDSYILIASCSCPYRALDGCAFGYPGRCPGLIVAGLSARHARCRSSIARYVGASALRARRRLHSSNARYCFTTHKPALALTLSERASSYCRPLSYPLHQDSESFPSVIKLPVSSPTTISCISHCS